jgi:triphosphatase
MSLRQRQSTAASVSRPTRGRSPANGAGGGEGDEGDKGEAREVEWQLAAPDLGVVQRWLQAHAVLDQLSIEPLPLQSLHDTYLDTEDWRIFRAGFALRVRHKEGQVEATLKGLHSARSGVADRREISEPLPRGAARERAKALARAAGPVASRVHDVAGAKPLRTLFEVRTSRQRYAVRSRSPAAAVGEIALDEARFSRANGHRRPMVLTRVELEATGPDQPALERLAQRLCAECGLRPAAENKFAVGLRCASLEPPRLGDADRKAQPVQAAIEPSTRAADFAAAALWRLLEEWRAHEPAARLGEGPEGLHALRTTGRRMDTVLRLFDDYLPPALVKSQPRLKSLVDALGEVRDADIRLEVVGKFRSGLPEADRPALDPLLRQLELERSAARSGMLRALDAKAARDWLDMLPGQLARATAPAPPGSARGAAALSVVPDLIRKRYRKLRKCAHRLTPESSLKEFHKVRIRTKKLRYALEIVAPTYAKAADEMLAALHKLQSKLGTQHDDGAIAGYLTQLAVRPPAGFTPQTLFMMGRMAEQHAREAARLSGRIEKPWRKVRGKRWKALHSRMNELRDGASARSNAANGVDHGARHGRIPAGLLSGSQSRDASRH